LLSAVAAVEGNQFDRALKGTDGAAVHKTEF